MKNNDLFFNNNYIIKDDYKIYKNPKILDKSANYTYNVDDTSIFSYGNIIDSLLQTLTPYELEKLRLLALFVSGQGINNLDNNELLSLIRIAIDPQYDSTIRNLGIRINSQNNNNIINNSNTIKPNPSIVPVTSPIQSITTQQNTSSSSVKQKMEEVKRANPIVEKFLSDIRKTSRSGSFRGWMLPNGELLSQYVDTTLGSRGVRQDHAKLYKVFMAGLEKYNKDAFDKINNLYSKYLQDHGVSSSYDWDESFAVEILGWMQIAHNGALRILYRGERWQDRLLRPFLYDYGFGFEISDFGDCHYVEFMDLYNHIDEIILQGLEEKYQR